MSALERFWAKVDLSDPDGCWPWTASKKPNGYGQFEIAAKNYYAHRVAYETTVAPIQPGLVIDHLCRRRACVNPAHMEPVTIRENLMRGPVPVNHETLKTHCPRGHAYDGHNIRGARICHTCMRAADRRRRAGRRA